MKSEIHFENQWSEDDKRFFIEHYLPRNRWIDWILLAAGILFFIAMMYGITHMHKQFTDFIVIWIVDVLLIANFFLADTINKQLLEMKIRRHASLVLKADGLYTDGIHHSIDQAVISNSFLFFRIKRKVLMVHISEAETADVLEMVKEKHPFSFTQTAKTFTITKFARRKGVY